MIGIWVLEESSVYALDTWKVGHGTVKHLALRDMAYALGNLFAFQTREPVMAGMKRIKRGLTIPVYFCHACLAAIRDDICCPCDCLNSRDAGSARTGDRMRLSDCGEEEWSQER